MDKTIREALYRSFAGWFHQDCLLDDPDWQSIVRKFVAESHPATVALVKKGLTVLSSSGLSEAQLNDKIISELGSYYLPSAEGMGFEEWLSRVRELIEEQEEQLPTRQST
jgi:hypothetical protein